MGLFSSKKIVVVASTVYNMAGEEANRPNFMKANLYSAMLASGHKQFLGERVVYNMLSGPSIRQRSFFNWSVRQDLPGLPTFSVSNKYNVDASVVTPYITVPAGKYASPQIAFVSDGDYSDFAEQWILDNNPAVYNTEWVADYDNIAHEITIQYEGGGSVTFSAGAYDATKAFLVCKYNLLLTVDDSFDSGPFIYIYEMDTGTVALDALKQDQAVSGVPEFFPALPIRLDNKSLAHEDFDDITGTGLYTNTANAYKRATGGQSIDDILTEVDGHEDVGDIDHAYIQFGVVLNVLEPSCRKYIYKFMVEMANYQNASPSYIGDFVNDVSEYETAIADHALWLAAQDDPFDPLYGTPEPVVPDPSLTAIPDVTTIRINSDHAELGSFDHRLSWVSVDEELFTGLGKVGAKTGELWFEKGQVLAWDTYGFQDDGWNQLLGAQKLEETFLYWQTGPNTYKRLTIWGLIHQNFVYGGKSVDITAHEAIDDPDPSGFLFPLHNPTMMKMSLKDSTQMSTADTFIVFNSYVIYKKKWYQTFLGMLFVLVLFIVVLWFVAPQFLSSAVGLLGTNAAVGLSLGFAAGSMAAVIAGAVANLLAAMFLTHAVTAFSVAVFGEKLGQIIGAILSFALNFGFTNGFDQLTFANLLTPQNLLKFSSSLANGYAGFVASAIGDINTEMEQNLDEYETEYNRVADMINRLGGNNDLSFDPMQLTDVDAGNDRGSYVPETLDEFIHRTTMTGSDIADVTLSLIEDYAELNLILPES